ncbi:hypothetical protein Z517_06474 [Fonsecaea pedrosoi CBS 271.37]|uniref:Uncharacterized protein n=1 Tax=Fonsecaea pedrosoi CBS 271.37 TaxID=1442368 RepID=A0A0D2H5A4_9EURO|nr:uncharacterized protein Z517_06474 [Fonsecaea pedrosoi CBS 271.37]KIW79859.1 hypothetical protein Z517_06474 [Fonsecaea pedrosoi CBS 271.37]
MESNTLHAEHDGIEIEESDYERPPAKDGTRGPYVMDLTGDSDDEYEPPSNPPAGKSFREMSMTLPVEPTTSKRSPWKKISQYSLLNRRHEKGYGPDDGIRPDSHVDFPVKRVISASPAEEVDDGPDPSEPWASSSIDDRQHDDGEGEKCQESEAGFNNEDDFRLQSVEPSLLQFLDMFSVRVVESTPCSITGAKYIFELQTKWVSSESIIEAVGHDTFKKSVLEATRHSTLRERKRKRESY